MSASPIIPVEQSTGRVLPWVIAVMTFLMIMTMAIVLGLNRAAGFWQIELSSSLTVEIPAGDTQLEAVANAVTTLRETAGVLQARQLPRSEVEAAVRPWLGDDVALDAIPLPALIHVELDPAQRPDQSYLQNRLAEVAPDSAIDDHQQWMNPTIRLLSGMKWTALAVAVLVASATVAVIIFSTRAAFASQVRLVDLLHDIGAEDRFIARQFQRHSFMIGLMGGLIGLALGIILLLTFKLLVDRNILAFYDIPLLAPKDLLLLLVVPVFAVFLTTITARLTVMFALSRLN